MQITELPFAHVANGKFGTIQYAVGSIIAGLLVLAAWVHHPGWHLELIPTWPIILRAHLLSTFLIVLARRQDMGLQQVLL